jgi:serine protease Do
MNGSHWSRNGLVLVCLIGITMIPGRPAGAQTPGQHAGQVPVQAYPLPPAARPTLPILPPRAGLTPYRGVAGGGGGAGGTYDYVYAAVHDQGDELLGATLQPVGETLRAHLDIPAGQGLLVTSLRGDGPSAQAGLKPNDVLLSLADKPLAAPGDLAKQLKAAGEAPVPLKLLRGGKPLTIQVRPVYRVTLGPAPEQKTEYFIGVALAPVDDALRAQLGLSAGQGVVVSEVIGGSPAEKTGVKKHDVVLEYGGKAIDGPEALAREVQAGRDTPTVLKVLRGGKGLSLPITAGVRKVEAPVSSSEYALYTLGQRVHDDLRFPAAYLPPGSEDLQQKLDRLEKELKALRAALDKLSDALKAEKDKKPE